MNHFERLVRRAQLRPSISPAGLMDPFETEAPLELEEISEAVPPGAPRASAEPSVPSSEPPGLPSGSPDAPAPVLPPSPHRLPTYGESLAPAEPRPSGEARALARVDAFMSALRHSLLHAPLPGSSRRTSGQGSSPNLRSSPELRSSGEERARELFVFRPPRPARRTSSLHGAYKAEGAETTAPEPASLLTPPTAPRMIALGETASIPAPQRGEAQAEPSSPPGNPAPTEPAPDRPASQPPRIVVIQPSPGSGMPGRLGSGSRHIGLGQL